VVDQSTAEVLRYEERYYRRRKSAVAGWIKSREEERQR
jgi:hypothetical protein